MRSICGRRRARIEKRHNYVYVPQNCRKTVPRRLTRMVVALLLVLLETELSSSNVIGFFGMTPAFPDSTIAQATMTPALPRTDPAVQTITRFLKKFQVGPALRKRLAEALVRSSRKHNVDPRLAASIMIVESRGNPFAISPSNAVGIMQIHVPTWARTIEEQGINLFKIEDNIDFGVRVLKNYVQRYGHDEGIKRYNGWNPGSPQSVTADAYLQKVQRIYLSSSSD